MADLHQVYGGKSNEPDDNNDLAGQEQISLTGADDLLDEIDGLLENNAEEFVRYFEVPGMGHVRGGVATDQYDALAALVDWVESGSAPDQLTAWVNPANPELPADWSADRSRPLCLYPATARYHRGDPESATSFRCVGDKPQTGHR